MTDDATASRGKHVLTAVLVLVVIGLAAVLAGLKYGRSKGKGLRPAAPPRDGADVEAPSAPPKEDPHALKLRLRRICQEARVAMHDGDYAAAYEHWREAHELAPDDAEIASEFENARLLNDFLILFEQGEAASGVLDFGQALVYYEKALELLPKSARIDQARIDEKIRLCRYAIAKDQAEEAERAEDWKTAEAKYKEALSHSPESDLARKGLARVQQMRAPPEPSTAPPPPEAELQAKVRVLQDRINALQKENLIESFQEASKLCDELERLLAKYPDAQKQIQDQKKKIAEKQRGYQQIYSERVKQVKDALAAGEPGRAIALAEQFKGKYLKDTAELDALIMECRRRTVMSDMVLVPEGMYEVGSDEGPSPRRKVIVRSFFIDRHEVTNQQYKAFVDATGYRWPRFWNEGKFPPGLEHYPVMGIAYVDADNFCKWAGKRLPTEDEWEVAASGGQPKRFPWGNEFIPGYAVTSEKGVTGPTMVGAHPDGKSPFGALDMIGNVAEWTLSTIRDPKDPARTLHIAKGGNFFHPSANCTIASRLAELASQPLIGYGFRTVLDATPEAIEKYKKQHSSTGSEETSSR